ncbi:MAG TPA: MBL fold metallo-hydrolase [Sphingobacteriaceae bacterium]|nr:MBL fold metallo-hydrolase [Sphingobacteriaceae bacterium]
MKAFPLYEGSYSVDSSKKFIPFDSRFHERKDRPASLFIYIQPFLIKTDHDLIVVDTGLGFNNEQGEFVLHENIRKAGFSPGDVTLVLMSHLHYDHAGGMVRDNKGVIELSFPNAEYIIQRSEWEAAYSNPSDSYHTDIFDVVQRSGSIRFVEGNGQLNDEISYELTGGHSEFHQVFKIKSDEETYFFGGDVLPEPEQLLRKFAAKYDFDGRKSMQLREEFGKKAAEENWVCLYYHAKSQAMSRVASNEDSFTIIPLNID